MSFNRVETRWKYTERTDQGVKELDELFEEISIDPRNYMAQQCLIQYTVPESNLASFLF